MGFSVDIPTRFNTLLGRESICLLFVKPQSACKGLTALSQYLNMLPPLAIDHAKFEVSQQFSMATPQTDRHQCLLMY
jgi:hypothetical protein